MAEISAQLVKQLRDKTGAGMGKCKEALQASTGDLKKAEEWLRAQGVKADVVSRATAEGVVVAKVAADHKSAAVVELKCETDFAAKNDRFRALAANVAEVVLAKAPADVAAALAAPMGPATVDLMIKAEISGVIKENIKFDWFERRALDGAGRIAVYVHSNGKLAVLVGLKAPSDAIAAKPEFEALAKDVAMHIAGSNPFPVSVDRAGVAKDLVDAEKAFVMKQLDQDPKESKKPPQIKEKIAEGKMGRFFKEKCLLEQPFVKDDSKTVEQFLAESGKALGGAPSVAWFVRRQIGG